MAKVNVNKNKSISGGTLYSTDTTHTLATAHDIYDEKRECYVEDYNFGVQTINGTAPDENGNFNIPAKGVQTVNGVAPDSNGNVNTLNTTYTAGTNVQISANNVISATDTTYTAGEGINISGSKVSNSGVRSLTQNGSVITVNTGGNTSTITIPESGKIDNISINNKNVTISNKTAQLPVVTITAWDESSDNTTTFSFVGQKNS